MYSNLSLVRMRGNRYRLLINYVTPFGTVPADFETDIVSVPWIFRWFIHRGGSLKQAAVFHDWCYKTAYKNKKYADLAFKKIAQHYKAPAIKVHLAYIAVRLFGRGNY